MGVVVKKSVIALSVVLGLSGCGLMQQYQQQQMQQQQQIKMDQYKAELDALAQSCNSQFATDPGLDPLRVHINFGSSTDSLEQIASTKKPTAKEKPAILIWDEIASKCTEEREKLLIKYNAPAGFVQNLRKFGDEQKQLRANLWAGKISYGQYLKSAKANYSNLDKENQALEVSLQQQARQAQMQQAQINAVNAQAAAAVMSAQAQQQSANAQTMMMFNQAQQQQRKQFNAPGTATNPVQTNCNRIGNSVNCQTYSY
jgi:hypothetical protein